MAESLTTMLTAIGSIVTAVAGWVGDFAEVIVTNPLLFVMVPGVLLAGAGVGFLNRLIRV